MTTDSVAPPVARRVPHEEHWHGRVYRDDWFWLREKESPAVRAYLEAENAYTEARTAHLKPLQQKLYDEMVARVQQTDLSVPVRIGAAYYYARTVEGMQYPIRCRKAATTDGRFDDAATEQVLLDQNEMAKGLAYLGIGDTQVSDDGRRYAFTTDETGFRQYSLHVKDLDSGEVTGVLAERVTSVEWAADGETLFYVTEDATTKRSNQLWRRRPDGKPELLFEEKDELYSVDLSRTKDRRFLLLGCASKDTADWRCLDARRPDGEFEVMLPREKGVRYFPTHRDGVFYLRTDRDALDFKVVAAPEDALAEAGWREVVPHREGVFVASFEVFRDFAVVQERVQGLNRFRVLSFADGSWREIEFPEQVYAAGPGGTPEYTSTTYRIDYQSMVTPPCVYDYDLASLDRELKKQQQVNGYDPSHYVTERVWAKARDGASIPVSVVRRRGTSLDGTAPLWLYGYGSYGISIPAGFNSDRFSLLDRGVVFAIAHVRGSGTLGEGWRKAGMLMQKKNTFTDFVDCAEHLVADGWAARDKVMAEGGSAGGLLMGVIANDRPDLWRAIHSAVPFVDIMNTMMDASLPLTVGEYLEWGNPNEQAAFDYMMSYSPYDNLEAKAYPATLVTTSFNDSQVMYWEPAKYVAKLRTLKTDDHELLLKCKLEAAGHGGASGRYDRWKDRAFEMAWMLAQVGVTE
ncbi:MAG: S9 family peptidase [Planctomycetes bacterium]|nr:S9 family peptidase [Planctomycetota bacterium]